MARDKNGFYKDTNGQEHDEVYISRLNKNDGTPMPREQYTFSEWADRYSDLVESGAIEDPDYQAASDRTPQNKSNQNNPNPQANDETQPSQTQPEKNETEQPKSNIDVNKQERQAIFDKYGFELDRDSRVFIAGHFQYNVPMSSKYTYIDGYNGELSDPRGASFFYPNADAITVVEYWRATAKIKGGVFLDAWIRQNRDFADRHAEARPDCINLDIISGNDGFGNRLKPTGSDDERRTAEFDNGFVKCFYMEKRQFTYIYAQSNDVENGEAQCVAMIERFYDYLDDDEVKELYDAIIEEIAYSVRLYN
jgi:hypothetical protein